ncbi:hypothetical protein GQ42DRAFT_171662 [Ramicandelaber brevisporus]|nr:hypothetical protein GQ42DRAFT_171662 [Ramicandelaber brevisporus]
MKPNASSLSSLSSSKAAAAGAAAAAGSSSPEAKERDSVALHLSPIEMFNAAMTQFNSFQTQQQQQQQQQQSSTKNDDNNGSEEADDSIEEQHDIVQQMLEEARERLSEIPKEEKTTETELAHARATLALATLLNYGPMYAEAETALNAIVAKVDDEQQKQQVTRDKAVAMLGKLCADHSEEKAHPDPLDSEIASDGKLSNELKGRVEKIECELNGSLASTDDASEWMKLSQLISGFEGRKTARGLLGMHLGLLSAKCAQKALDIMSASSDNVNVREKDKASIAVVTGRYPWLNRRVGEISEEAINEMGNQQIPDNDLNDAEDEDDEYEDIPKLPDVVLPDDIESEIDRCEETLDDIIERNITPTSSASTEQQQQPPPAKRAQSSKGKGKGKQKSKSDKPMYDDETATLLVEALSLRSQFHLMRTNITGDDDESMEEYDAAVQSLKHAALIKPSADILAWLADLDVNTDEIDSIDTTIPSKRKSLN